MRSVALKTLEGQITEYVGLAQRGETVLITDQDHIIAELTPHVRRGEIPWSTIPPSRRRSGTD